MTAPDSSIYSNYSSYSFSYDFFINDIDTNWGTNGLGLENIWCSETGDWETNHIPCVEVRFKDMFPISLGELSYDQAADDITTLCVDVTFKYQQYTIVAL